MKVHILRTQSMELWDRRILLFFQIQLPSADNSPSTRGAADRMRMGMVMGFRSICPVILPPLGFQYHLEDMQDIKHKLPVGTAASPSSGSVDLHYRISIDGML